MGVSELLSDWPAPDVAAGALPKGSDPQVFCGEGSQPRTWASVTKLVSALAVLVAVEEGSVDLDQPAGPPRATVRHLMAHASGLGVDDDRILAPPGQRRIYSNTGYEVLAASVADRTGIPFDQYATEAVLQPLAMKTTAWQGSAAAGLVGPLEDLLRLGAELLRPTLVADATLAEATSVAFPGLAGVLPGVGQFDPLDWGLGFELRDGKAPHWTGRRNSPATFGHFGRSGSFLWVDPDAGVAAAALTGREFGSWALRAWPAYSDAVLDELGQT